MVRRPLFALLLAFAVIFSAVAPAAAGRQWCFRDPIYAINGKNVSIDIAVPDNQQKAVSGPIYVTIYVPHDVTVKGVFQDSGFNGYGEIPNIARSRDLVKSKKSVEFIVEVIVPTKSKNIDVLVNVTPKGQKTLSVIGKSNKSVTIKTSARF